MLLPQGPSKLMTASIGSLNKRPAQRRPIAKASNCCVVLIDLCQVEQFDFNCPARRVQKAATTFEDPCTAIARGMMQVDVRRYSVQ